MHGSSPGTPSSNVDTSAVESYTVTYTATDLDGNTATDTRTVNVVDTTAPVVTVTGAASVTVELGGTYIELGASVTDASASIPPLTYVNSGTVDTDKIVSYIVAYQANDASGN